MNCNLAELANSYLSIMTIVYQFFVTIINVDMSPRSDCLLVGSYETLLHNSDLILGREFDYN